MRARVGRRCLTIFIIFITSPSYSTCTHRLPTAIRLTTFRICVNTTTTKTLTIRSRRIVFFVDDRWLRCLAFLFGLRCEWCCVVFRYIVSWVPCSGCGGGDRGERGETQVCTVCVLIVGNLHIMCVCVVAIDLDYQIELCVAYEETRQSNTRAHNVCARWMDDGWIGSKVSMTTIWQYIYIWMWLCSRCGRILDPMPIWGCVICRGAFLRFYLAWFEWSNTAKSCIRRIRSGIVFWSRVRHVLIYSGGQTL